MNFLARIPPVWLILAGITSVQFGGAIGKGLFSEVTPTGVVWMRLATSALILLALVRPRIRGRSARDWGVVVAYGGALTLMNWAIYQSFARIPLGLAVAIEFIGPLTVALFGSRQRRDFVWILLVAFGVGLLGFTPTRLDPVGIGFALLAGAAWAGYILLSRPVGRRWEGTSGLALGSLLGASLLVTPAVMANGATFTDPRILLIGVTVGILSSVIPYSLELTALRRMPPRLFGLLMSLEPAAAAIAALIVLGEVLAPLEVVAVAAIVVASVGATRSSQDGKA